MVDSFNKTGMAFFVFAFLFSVAFFLFVTFYNPGPIDKARALTSKTFTKDETDERLQGWIKPTDEASSLGLKLYTSNCAYCHSVQGSDKVLDKLERGVTDHQGKQTNLYRIIVRGYEGKHRMDHLPMQQRWALVHYLRSVMKSPMESSKDDWGALYAEGF